MRKAAEKVYQVTVISVWFCKLMLVFGVPLLVALNSSRVTGAPRAIAFLPCFAPLRHGSVEHLHHAQEVGNIPLSVTGGDVWISAPPPTFLRLGTPPGLSHQARVPVRRLYGSGAENLATKHPLSNDFVLRH